MAQRRVLVVYALPYSDYAGALIQALRQREPDWQYVPLDNAGAATFDDGTLVQYDRVIVLLSPELVHGQASASLRQLLIAYAALWAGGQRQIIPVVLRPVGRPDFMPFARPVEAENLYAAQLAEVFARQRLLEGLPNDGRPDTTYVWGEERVTGWAPPPPPPAYPPSPDDTTRGQPLPPPPPPAPAPYVPSEPSEPYGSPSAPPAPASEPYQPPYQPPVPPAAPPPYATVPQAPPSPGQLPPGYLDQMGGAASDRAQPAGRYRLVEYLQFSAFHPNEAPVEAPQTCLVYTHLPQQISQVQKDAGTFTELGSAPVVAQGQSLRKIARNVEITVEPHMDGVTFSPPRDSFIWRGEWHRSLFRYSGVRALAGNVRRGWIDIYADRVSPICTIEVAFSFHAGIAASALSVPRGMAVTGNTFDAVFISYSHRDHEAMAQARETYQKLGVTTYHDDQLAAGDNYEQRLSGMIRAANIFHLLWSDASARSAEVRKEWMLALESQKGERFIRPWYWQQPIVPPPPELAAQKISFRYEHLRRRLLRPSTWL